MRFKLALLLAGAFLFLTVPVFAGPISFCTSGSYGPTDVGSSVTSGGLTATGWMGTSTTTSNTATDLSCKDQGTAEFGLGIFADPTKEGEISNNDFVQVAGLAGATVTVIESAQSGEGFELLGSDTNGVLGTDSLGSGTGCGTCTVSFNMGSNTYLDITASSGNVLLDSVATPEPSTYLLMGTGLLMLGLLARRKFASASV
ncbi:MAG TPA: PEP-CTERM sorting domain-containing protein [Candidatus Acidoferrales bacterium]|nr:PEP-CTERM sorting domain-containing protein [Candidatus Acidoferrales bacterium]